MNTFARALYAALCFGGVFSAHALDLAGADGSDGALAVGGPTPVVINLAMASVGSWNSAPTQPGNGVFDPDRWIVVYKYSSVQIGNISTVVFENHPSGAPVAWLVSGDVNIAGEILLNGQEGNISSQARPGPGGFRGGRARNPEGIGWTSGFGPGGGIGGGPGGGNPGSFAIKASEFSGDAYGSADLHFLIGGSGAGNNGAAGGGAILIASEGRITLSGAVRARGGRDGSGFGGGAGGAIRLIAETIQGSGGLIDVAGGQSAAPGSPGRIALSARTFEGTFTALNAAITTLTQNSIQVFDDLPPRVKILSIGGLNAPNEFRGVLGLGHAAGTFNFGTSDIFLPAGQHQVLMETSNLPTNALVKLHVVPVNAYRQTFTAEFISGNYASARWAASLHFTNGMNAALQAHAAANE